MKKKQKELELLIYNFLTENDLQFVLHSNRDENYIKIDIEKNLINEDDNKGRVSQS